EAAAAAQAGASAPAGPATGPAEPTPEVAPVASEPARALAARVVAALEAVVAALQDAEAELGRLDAVAGDGDHGRGMVRGTTAARDAARAAADAGAGAGDVLARAGRAWAGQAGGTSGVLWGAMLEAAAEVLPDRPETWERWAREPVRLVADAVDAAAAALRRLGGAEVGDKTMLDALAPFGAALAADPGAPLAAAWRAAADAARAAAEATADLRPRVGRARPLAERSVGTPDPGATSLALAARAAAEVAS
ncbi:MAG: DAK2 domain-containing protein, partial [Actinomycetales bacterium]|nr:DAK2 domain-containing protein [Actinomycetales bacterium]